jgi:hypothetical protein
MRSQEGQALFADTSNLSVSNYFESNDWMRPVKLTTNQSAPATTVGWAITPPKQMNISAPPGL